MADEELKVTLKNEEFVRKLNETQKAIQETKKAMDDLYKSQSKHMGVEELNNYIKKQNELKGELQDLAKQEDELINKNKGVVQSTDELGEAAGNMTKKLGLAAIAIGLITKLAKEVVVALKDTVAGMKAITIAGEVWKQIAYNIAVADFNITKFNISLANAIGAAKMMNKERAEDRKDLIASSQLREDFNRLYFESANRTKSLTYQLDKLTEAERVHNELIDIELENATRQLAITALQLVNRPKSNKLLDQEAQILAKINSIEGQRYSEIKRVEMRRSSLENEIRKEMFQKYYEEIEARLKIQDEFQSLSLKLMDEYERSQIEILKGNDKIRAQRDYGLKQLEEFRKQMERLGKLSAEQEKQFAIIGAGIWMAFYEGLTKEAQKALPQKDIDAISKVLLPKLAGIQKSIIRTTPATEYGDFSIWKLIGLDPDSEDDQEMIDAITQSAQKIDNILNEVLDNRVEIAQRERELLDTRIAETQRSIEIEAELYQEGYANSLDSQKAYLTQLKTERAKALAEEEKAIKRQQLYDKITQTGALLTSVAQILSHATKMGLVGLALAPFAIATLFAIWGKAKSSTTKLEEGGSGTVTGKRHHAGGERFLDHVEIEQGEQWGVLSRRASSKYGDMFHDMVSSFNRDQMPEFVTPTTTNLVRVDNNGPNSRLDRVIKEQEKMNTQLKQGQLYTVGNKRILKSGNKIRITG